jgi:SAM-dependent methyltransferase
MAVWYKKTMTSDDTSKRFWNKAATENPSWYIATRSKGEDEAFFESGTREVDLFLAQASLALGPKDTVLEIGSGAGRMTKRLAELSDRVIATDVSGNMLALARKNLAGRTNVTYVELTGDGDLPIDTGTVDAVFSYITMQHVPTAKAQELYFAEAIRVTRLGGWVLIQFRRSGIVPRLIEALGHLVHFVSGHKTLSKAWRGARLSEARLRSYSGSGRVVEIWPLGRRHIWAVVRPVS